MSQVIAEITVDHPTRSVIDQLDAHYLRKSLSASEYSALVLSIADARSQLNHPMTGALLFPLSDGREVRVTKYAPIVGEPGTVRIEKRAFASPAEEIAALVQAELAAHPTLTPDEALGRVVKMHSPLWHAHMQAQRAGRGNPQSVTKTEPPTVEAILKQAKAQALAEGSSLRAVLEAGVKDHPDEPQYYAAYSRFQLSAAGLEEHLHGAGARR